MPISIINLPFFSNNEIVLATYQSYISNELASEANSKFGVQTVYFENDRDILSGFKTGAYDLAIISSSTLEEAIEKKIVKPIDWAKFSSLNQDLKDKLKSFKENQNEKIQGFNSLYSPIVNNFFKEKPQLSEYGLPYFLSYFTFAYKCKDCPKELDNSSGNWGEQFQSIINQKEKDNKSFKLGIIEDEVTILSLSKLSSKEYKDKKSWKDNQNSKDFFSQYKELSKLGLRSKNRDSSIFMNSDSALMSEMFIKDQLQGVFMYNGDALYSYKELKNNNEERAKDFRLLNISPSLWLLDQIAISYKINGEKEEKIYRFLDKLLFSGAINNKNKEIETQKTESNNIKNSWAWRNFEFLQYTPVLKEMQEVIKGENKDKQEEKEYDDMMLKLLFGGDNEKECGGALQKEEKCNIVFESGMTDSQNLDLSLAFQKWKNNRYF
ncbi:hypothetical protein PRV_02800 [Mycoplasma parvum str. Indiana]|uniref:Spermidine/putrescine ABC transporter substrate-binding protein n=1 Tax=Mycoplasma parvum str. Indiana TaxID=1403316 RepID=U5NCH6_9MOLU|nr:hypothetical protein PRV_02800 [Mycoplasma parvum str. Indiana]